MVANPGERENRWFAEMIRQVASAELTEEEIPRLLVVEQVRRLITGAISFDASREAAERIATSLRLLAAEVEANDAGYHYRGFAEAGPAGTAALPFFRSPVSGQLNPLAPPLELRVGHRGDAEVVEGRVLFSPAYEGPPGCVHGGWIAAVFDELLGMAQSLSGHPGMTASLTVDYVRPTPLLAELELSGRLDSVAGRKVFTSGELTAGGEVTARAKGLFISVDLARLAGYARQVEERRGGVSG